jgi:DNA-binding CsgD family transcriptional regulator
MWWGACVKDVGSALRIEAIILGIRAAKGCPVSEIVTFNGWSCSMTKKLMGCPAWLGLSGDRTSFVFMPERAKIVRRIFELSIAGYGGYTIARILNEKKVPVFGRSPKWDQSTIHNMLRNRATIGERQPGKYRNKNEIPISNFYPPVIEESVFNAAQEARQRNLASGRGRKGRLITNLFSRLPTCSYCGSRMKFHSKGQAKSLVCQAVLEGTGCYRFGWSYSNFESSFFDFLDKNEPDLKLSEELQRLRKGIQTLSSPEIYDARAEISQILKTIVVKLTIASAGASPQSSQPDARIRRDHPKRYFSAVFSDRSLRTGYPLIPPHVRSTRKFDPVDLSKSLGLSPRQGTLTALLAEGETLTFAAEKLGMTLATARWHLREIFRKTNLHSQADLVSLAEKTSVPTSVNELVWE